MLNSQCLMMNGTVHKNLSASAGPDSVYSYEISNIRLGKYSLHLARLPQESFLVIFSTSSQLYKKINNLFYRVYALMNGWLSVLGCRF